jgi:hypothetical protein
LPQTNWQGVLTDCVNLLASHAVPQEHILHLLEELPVEAHNEQLTALSRPDRQAFREQLKALRPHVVAYLAAVDVGKEAGLSPPQVLQVGREGGSEGGREAKG